MLETVTQEPFNAQSPRAALRADQTPTDEFFVRNHFPRPDIEAASWSLKFTDTRTPVKPLTLAALRDLPSKRINVLLECAGNGRSRMTPKPPGTPWGERAVACASFRGVPLANVLPRHQLNDTCVELLFRGADEGEAHGHHMAFERSLDLERAYHPDTMLVYEMNDEPLTPDHGAPVRLLVPGWYGVASVKWLVEIRALTTPFDGFYQAEHYVYRGAHDGGPQGPVRETRVKSMIFSHGDGDKVTVGRRVGIEGKAWSGNAPIRRVQVSTDGGQRWTDAMLGRDSGPYAWRGWRLEWSPPAAGPHILCVRAEDSAGNVQPEESMWNELGYGHNPVHRVTVQAA